MRAHDGRTTETALSKFALGPNRDPGHIGAGRLVRSERLEDEEAHRCVVFPRRSPTVIPG